MPLINCFPANRTVKKITFVSLSLENVPFAVIDDMLGVLSKQDLRIRHLFECIISRVLSRMAIVFDFVVLFRWSANH